VDSLELTATVTRASTDAGRPG